jgi:hypothetical protein
MRQCAVKSRPILKQSLDYCAVVQHVQILEASGLVRTQKVGRTRTCSLDHRPADHSHLPQSSASMYQF